MSDKWGRRQFIKTSGATAIATILAGCGGEDTESNDKTPRSTEAESTEPVDTASEFTISEDSFEEVEEQTSSPENQASGDEFEYLIGLETDYHLNPQQDGSIEREFTAYSEGRRTTYTKTFSQAIYEFYYNQSRQYVNNFQYKYGSYVSDMLDKYLMDSLVSEFEDYGEKHNQSERQIIEHMMSFVQNLKYTSDKRGTGWNDYPKYPLETLVEQDGDCEDTAILMANLLRNYGYSTKLIYATGDMTDRGYGGHMAVGILGGEDVQGTYYEDDNGDKYYFIETTAPDNPIGEAPSWMNSAYLRPVDVHPVPGAVSAKVTGVSDGQIRVEGETVNTGSAGSNRIQIRVTLIDSQRNIIDQAISGYKSVSGFGGNIDDLGPEHEATAELTLNARQVEGMKLVSESYAYGEEVSQTESELRNP